jgi:hypothetical protein
MPGSSSWVPYAPQGVKGFADDDKKECETFYPAALGSRPLKSWYMCTNLYSIHPR